MTDENRPALDEDQGEVAEAGAEERLCVTAGPGSGKTETVSARIEHLLNEEGLTGNEILVISFSRAAVEAVQRRQRRNGARSWVWVTTLDSLATRILNDEGRDTSQLGFDKRILLLTKMLAEDGVPELLPDVKHVIVDEVQDVVGIRANLVALILDKLPPSTGFTLLGDPKQGIYDFQLDDDSDDPAFLSRRAMELGARKLSLSGQYRAESKDSKYAMHLRGTGQTTATWVRSMCSFLAGMPQFDAEGLAEQLPKLHGTTAVLTQSNAQALTVARGLHSHGILADLLARTADQSIDRWVAGILADVPGSLTRDQFLGLAQDRVPIDPGEAWVILRTLTRANTKYLNIPEVARRLATGIVPVAFTRRRGAITVSTVHRAKGLEFDHVMLLDPGDWFGEQNESFARALYVAITRPRRRLFSFRLSGADGGWKTLDGTERAYRTTYQGKGTIGFEIRATDWRRPEPPNADDPATAQEALERLASAGKPVPAEIRLCAFNSTLSRPSYDAHVDGVKVGTVSDRFADAFVRRVGIPKGGWPRISRTYFVGTETVAGPPQNGPVGKNGLWLSPLIVGPAELDWSKP